MKDNFSNFTQFAKKITSIRYLVYSFTVFFFIILILLMVYPLGDDKTLHWGNLHLKFDPINLGDLGGFLSGIFAPLAFLWLMLNMRQQDKNLEIAERQLTVLLQEKENRRKITKANFSITSPKPEGFNVNEKLLHFRIEIVSDIPLKDCYINEFNDISPFAVVSTYVKGEKNLFTSKKYINKDEFFYLNIVVNISSLINGLSVLEDSIELFYLDVDGFEQSQLFKIMFYLPENTSSSDSSTEMYAILLLVPQNN